MIVTLTTVSCPSGNPRNDRMAILSRHPLGHKPRVCPRMLGSRFITSNQNKKLTCNAVESLELATATETVHVRVQIKLSIAFGEHLCLVGSCEELGSWNVENAPKFHWTHGDVWVADVELPSGTRAEFKIVNAIPSSGVHIWEYTSNRLLEIPSVNEMKDGELILAWCDESMDSTVVKPVQMSSLASWDEADDEQTAAGSFAPMLDFFAGITMKDTIEYLEDTVDAQDSDVEPSESTNQLAENEVEDLLESQMDVETDIKPDSEEMPDEIVDEVLEEPQVETTIVEEEEQGTSSLKKAATAAGMVAAGVAGAALLSGLAVDIADTAVLGAFGVAAGSAAFGTKPTGKTGTSTNGSAELDVEEDISGKALSKEPGTIIAAGLAAAFEQTTVKK